MNAKKTVLLFRERGIHFWEDKFKITQINEHFEPIRRMAQNFE